MNGSEQSPETQEDTPRLRNNPDDVCRLVQLARDFHARETLVAEDRPESPADVPATGVMEGYTEDAVVGEFRSIVADLEGAQQVELIALMWLGRGDYDFPEWHRALRRAEESWSDQAGNFLLMHPLLAEHLEGGLERFGHYCA